jgi:hypothetical protein
MIKDNDTLRRLYYRLLRAKPQSDEAAIIDLLSSDCPRTFIEFGFHPAQFNCASLARNPDWRGLLVDSNARQVSDTRALLPDRIKIVQSFLALDNLVVIRSAFPQIGVLSIDVDGNDYWFLERLVDTRPSVICIEYNASMGLDPITVPYDPIFDRHQKHKSGMYHGASLTALAKLAASHGYGLAAVSNAGVNAFFTQDGTLIPEEAWRPNSFREKFSGKNREEQWATIRHLPFQWI